MFSPAFYQAAPVIAVCASLGAVPLIAASRRHPNLREFWTFAAAALKFSMVVLLAGAGAGTGNSNADHNSENNDDGDCGDDSDGDDDGCGDTCDYDGDCDHGDDCGDDIRDVLDLQGRVEPQDGQSGAVGDNRFLRERSRVHRVSARPGIALTGAR